MMKRTGDKHNKLIQVRGTALEQANLKAAALARGKTVTQIVWEAIYKFLGWK